MVKKTAPSLTVIQRKVADLTPYENNARTHSDEQLAQLGESIKEFGFTVPALVDENGGIIAGHGRVEAAKRIGMVEVPVIVAAGWGDAQKRAYVIADNKLALNSGWDMDKLKGELTALSDMGRDLTTLGFSSLELGDLMTVDAPAAPKRGGRGLGSPVIQFNIVFDNDAQQQAWFAFVRELKASYPDADTLGERLQLFIEARNGEV